MSIEKTDPIPFNTHRFVKRMVGVGMPEQQAEALADEQVNLLNSNLATKQDLAMGLAEVRREIEQVRSELMKFMIKLVLSAMGVQTAVIAVIMAVLIRFLA